jgi:hypothetical protein
MNIERIKAVSTPSFDIKAALASPEVRGVAKILAAAGVAQPTRPIPLAELNEKLSAAGVSVEKRLAVKIALSRVGLLADA